MFLASGCLSVARNGEEWCTGGWCGEQQWGGGGGGLGQYGGGSTVEESSISKNRPSYHNISLQKSLSWIRGESLSEHLKHSRAHFKLPKVCSARSQNARSCYLDRNWISLNFFILKKKRVSCFDSAEVTSKFSLNNSNHFAVVDKR